jgi:hypothetical protein
MPKLLMATWIAVPLLFAACASVQRPPHRDLMYAAAAECQAKYQSDVERYEFDRFGRIVAYYKENRSRQVLDPFFACYNERLREKIQSASSTQAAGPGRSTDVDSVGAPIWKRGHEWTYLWESPRGSGTFVWSVDRVETVDGLECYVIKSGSREIFWRTNDLTSVLQKNEGAIEIRYVPPRQTFAWPLSPGKTWEQQFTVERPQNRETQTRVQTWSVEGTESVVVPAGEFSTVKVVVRNKRNNSIAWEYWYSPTARQFVRVRDHLSYGIETRVLAAFKLD